MEYTLDFYIILKEMVDSQKWFRGEGFKMGYFIKLNRYGQLVLVDANNMYSEDTLAASFMLSLVNQKYREITVATINELNK